MAELFKARLGAQASRLPRSFTRARKMCALPGQGALPAPIRSGRLGMYLAKGSWRMAMIVKVAAETARELQASMDEEFAAAGIVRVLSANPPFYLVAADDVKELAAIAGDYRCKPRIAPAAEEDVPTVDQSEEDTEDLVEFIHRLGYTFNWDDDTSLWCVSGVRDGFPDDSTDEPAADRRQAAIEALRYLVA